MAFSARQVGYVVNQGPVFVVVGADNKQMILQCSVESSGGDSYWVTKTKEPAYVPVLNNSGGDTFPYAINEVTVDGYGNDYYITLGTDSYKRPNFAAKTYTGSYQNIANDWVTASFSAPNLIRNAQESASYGGVDGTPVQQTTVTTGTGTGVKTGGGTNNTGYTPAPSGNTTTTGSGNTTTVNGTTTSGLTLAQQQAAAAQQQKNFETYMLIGLGVIGLFVVIANANKDRR